MVGIVIIFVILYNILQPMAFYYGNYKHSSSYTGNTEFDPRFSVSGLENLSVINFNFTPEEKSQMCLFGKFIGNQPIPDVNCGEICKDYTGKQYVYRYFAKTTTIQGIDFKGSYCLPSHVTTCNTNTGTIVWQSGFIDCIAKYPNVIDKNNKIVGCKGSLRDNLTGVDYKNYISPQVVINDIDERLITGQRRFICSFTKDSNNNSFIATPNSEDRFERIQNPCTILLPSALPEKAKYTDEHKCVCSKPYSQLSNSPYSPCTACVSRYDELNKVVQVRRNVYTTQFVDYDNSQFIMPPGLDSASNDNNCELAEIAITIDFLPEAVYKR